MLWGLWLSIIYRVSPLEEAVLLMTTAVQTRLSIWKYGKERNAVHGHGVHEPENWPHLSTLWLSRASLITLLVCEQKIAWNDLYIQLSSNFWYSLTRNSLVISGDVGLVVYGSSTARHVWKDWRSSKKFPCISTNSIVSSHFRPYCVH